MNTDKIYILYSLYGKYDDVRYEFNGAFTNYMEALAYKDLIKIKINQILNETEYIDTLAIISISDEEYLKYLEDNRKREDALDYVDTYINEYELNKLYFTL